MKARIPLLILALLLAAPTQASECSQTYRNMSHRFDWMRSRPIQFAQIVAAAQIGNTNFFKHSPPAEGIGTVIGVMTAPEITPELLGRGARQVAELLEAAISPSPEQAEQANRGFYEDVRDKVYVSSSDEVEHARQTDEIRRALITLETRGELCPADGKGHVKILSIGGVKDKVIAELKNKEQNPPYVPSHLGNGPISDSIRKMGGTGP